MTLIHDDADYDGPTDLCPDIPPFEIHPMLSEVIVIRSFDLDGMSRAWREAIGMGTDPVCRALTGQDHTEQFIRYLRTGSPLPGWRRKR